MCFCWKAELKSWEDLTRMTFESQVHFLWLRNGWKDVSQPWLHNWGLKLPSQQMGLKVAFTTNAIIYDSKISNV